MERKYARYAVNPAAGKKKGGGLKHEYWEMGYLH